jgi:hypothetical protein
MKRWLFVLPFLVPVWGFSAPPTEYYLPQMRYSFAWDIYKTSVDIIDSTDGAYILVFRKNLYPYRIIDVANFRDFPPTGWSADPQWSKKLEISGSEVLFPAIVYTYSTSTGTYSITSSSFNLNATQTGDTIVFSYKLTGLQSSDTIKFLVSKDLSCWDVAGVLTSSDVATDRREGKFAIPLGGSCSISDNDQVHLRISFVDRSNVPSDTSKYFALYNLYVWGRAYRPRTQDTLSVSQANDIINDIKSAWAGVKNAIESFMGVSSGEKIIILVGPIHSSDPGDGQFPDTRIRPLLGFYDPLDINGRPIIYLNTAWDLYYSNFPTSDPDRIGKLRKYLAFQYARYIAYLADPSEADTSRYPLYLINMNITAKASWIAHKAMIANFDPDDFYSYARGIFNDKNYSFAVGTDATYLFSTATLYDGRVPRGEDIAKFTLWLSYLEELTSENEVKNAIKEQDVLFMYLPTLSTSVLNLISLRGKKFYQAYEEFVIKVFSAGRPDVQSISGFPTFSNPLLKNTPLTSPLPTLSLRSATLSLFSSTAYLVSLGTWITFDGSDGNRAFGDTITGWKVYLIDTVAKSYNSLTLDARNRGYSTSLPTYVLIINYGSSGSYVIGNKDTTDPQVKSPTLTFFAVQPNYAFNRYVDVYAMTSTAAYYDASSEGIRVIFYPDDSARFGFSVLTLSKLATNFYGASAYLSFKDYMDNPYYGPIRYKIYRLQSFAGFDYVLGTGVVDTGTIQSVRLGRELVEAYPSVLFMRSLAGEKEILVFRNGGTFNFSSPVDAEVKVKADLGDKVFVYNGFDWKEVEGYYNPERKEITAYISSAYGIYVGKDKPSSTPSSFKAFADGSRIRVILPAPSDINLTIYGMSGRKVKEITYKDLPAGSYEFELNFLPKGVYIARVKVGKNFTTVKVIRGGER